MHVYFYIFEADGGFRRRGIHHSQKKILFLEELHKLDKIVSRLHPDVYGGRVVQLSYLGYDMTITPSEG